MRIAIVHPSLGSKGGAQNVVVWLASGLRDRGHRVTVFTMEFDRGLWENSYTEGLEVRLVRDTLSFLNSKALTLLYVGWLLRKPLAGFDVVVCHLWPSNLWVARAKKLSRAFPRLVWYCQEPNRKLHFEHTDRNLNAYVTRAKGSPYNGHLIENLEREKRMAVRSKRRIRKRARDILWDKASARLMDLVLVNSRFSQESFGRVYGITPTVCYLGIPLNDQWVPRPDKDDYFCVVSPLRPKKNVQNVIEAMNILVNQWGSRDVRLKIAGEGPDRRAIEALASQYGLLDRIGFLGLVPDAQLPALYQGARFTLYVPIDEPFGLVPLESMACGTPVIVSDHGGFLDTVAHNETGLLVNPFDPQAIAHAVRELYEDGARIRAMGMKGSRVVRGDFTLDKFTERFEAVALSHPPR